MMSGTWSFMAMARTSKATQQHNLAILNSGVAKLGCTGARALATRGCAPPVQALLKIIGAECTVINHELDAKSVEIELRSIAICSTDLNVCVFAVVTLRCAHASS